MAGVGRDTAKTSIGLKTSTQYPATSNQKATNMEVHHPHTHTPRSKWTHYLWEFLMLFLAVTCGFLAENIREHAVENKKGRQYISSQIEDLKIDTANLGRISVYFVRLAGAIDTFLYSFEDFGKKGLSQLIVDYSLFQGYPDFIYTDRTIQQLKSSGELRLIHKEASDSIINYDSRIHDLMLELGAMARSYEALSDLFFKTINLKAFHDRLNKRTEPGTPDGIADILLTTDRRELYTLYNNINNYKLFLLSVSVDMDDLKEAATHLIAFLKKE